MTTLNNVNGNGRLHRSGRFDDGIQPDPRVLADLDRVKREATEKVKARHQQMREAQPDRPAVEPMDDDPEDLDDEPDDPPPPRTPAATPKGPPIATPPAKARRTDAVGNGPPRLTCDQHPGRQFSITQAAELVGVKPGRIYDGLERDHAIGKDRLRFRWIPGREPVKRPRKHKPDPRKAEAPAPPAKRKLGRPPKAKPRQTSPVGDIAGGTLTGGELARLAVALSDATSGTFAPGDAQQVFEWGAHVQGEFAKLRAILEGRATIHLTEGRVDAVPA